MDKKLKRMEFFLILASILIFFANISLLATRFIEDNIIKGIIGVVISSVLLFLSYSVKNNLKLDKSSSRILAISLLSFFITFTGTYYNVIYSLDEVYEFFKFGSLSINIDLFIPIFAIILSIIGYVLSKKDYYIKTILIASLFLIYFATNSIVISIGLSITKNYIEYLVLVLVLYLYEFLFGKKYSKTLSLTQICFIYYLTFNVNFTLDNVLISLLLASLEVFLLLIRIRREESRAFDIASFFALVVLLTYIMYTYLRDIYLIPLMFVIITDMLIVVFDIGKDRKEALGFKIVLDILTVIMLISSISTSNHTLATVLIVLVSSLASTYALKSDYQEQYILPFKLMLCIFGLILDFNKAISLDPIIIGLIINILAVIFSNIFDNKIFKRLFIIIALFALLIFIDVSNTFQYIVVLAEFLFDYFAIFINDKHSKWFRTIFEYLFIGFAVYGASVLNFEIIYLIFTIVFITFFVLVKDQARKNILLIGSGLSMLELLEKIISSSYTFEVLESLTIFGIFYYIILSFNVRKSFKDILLILLIVINTMTLWVMNTPVSIIVSLILNIIIALIYMKNNNNIYRTSLILTVISIFVTLSLIEKVPTFIYLLLIGILVIIVIYKSISKYLSEDHTKEEHKEPSNVNSNKKYCTECGSQLKPNAKFCSSCGKKVN